MSLCAEPLEASRAAPPDVAEAGSVFACALCGHHFDHGGRVCGACPMSGACDLVKCPHCGFQFPRSSRIADGLASLWKKWRRTR